MCVFDLDLLAVFPAGSILLGTKLGIDVELIIAKGALNR